MRTRSSRRLSSSSNRRESCRETQRYDRKYQSNWYVLVSILDYCLSKTIVSNHIVKDPSFVTSTLSYGGDPMGGRGVIASSGPVTTTKVSSFAIPFPQTAVVQNRWVDTLFKNIYILFSIHVLFLAENQYISRIVKQGFARCRWLIWEGLFYVDKCWNLSIQGNERFVGHCSSHPIECSWRECRSTRCQWLVLLWNYLQFIYRLK